MKKDKSPFTALLSVAAIAGDILFVLWILYNGINEDFQGTTVEKFSYVTLMGLLAVNAPYLFITATVRNNPTLMRKILSLPLLIAFALMPTLVQAQTIKVTPAQQHTILRTLIRLLI